LDFLCNYFDAPKKKKLISDLYLPKFLDIAAKFSLCTFIIDQIILKKRFSYKSINHYELNNNKMYSDVDCFENIIFDIIYRINIFLVDKKNYNKHCEQVFIKRK